MYTRGYYYRARRALSASDDQRVSALCHNTNERLSGFYFPKRKCFRSGKWLWRERLSRRCRRQRLRALVRCVLILRRSSAETLIFAILCSPSPFRTLTPSLSPSLSHSSSHSPSLSLSLSLVLSRLLFLSILRQCPLTENTRGKRWCTFSTLFFLLYTQRHKTTVRTTTSRISLARIVTGLILLK